MHNCSRSNFRYLRTPMGAVKLLNVAIGAICLILVSVSYESVWTLAVFTGTVTTCTVLSILHLVFCLLRSSAVRHSKANKVVSFLYNLLAGIALIVAGIELIGWSEYSYSKCRNDCPKLYTVGVAKTLTFMNGTLYLIVGFLSIKDDDLLDPEAADEDIPLFAAKTSIASIPGSIVGSKQAIHNGQSYNFYNYDHIFHQPKVPCDVRSVASSYRNQSLRPPPHQTAAEYSFNDSYNSASTYNNPNGTQVLNNGSKGKRVKKNGSSIASNNVLISSNLGNKMAAVDRHLIKV